MFAEGKPLCTNVKLPRRSSLDIWPTFGISKKTMVSAVLNLIFLRANEVKLTVARSLTNTLCINAYYYSTTFRPLGAKGTPPRNPGGGPINVLLIFSSSNIT